MLKYILFSLLVCGLTDNIRVPIELGVVYDYSFSTEYKNYDEIARVMRFQFKVPESFICKITCIIVDTNDAFLSFVVRPEDYRSDPDVMIFVEGPTGQVLVDTCQHFGLDVCYVDNGLLSQKDRIYQVDVTSEQTHCVFSIQARIERNNQLIPFGQHTRMTFIPDSGDILQPESEKLFKVHLPVDPKIHHFTVSMLVEKEHRGTLSHDIHMFVNLGNEPPTTYMTMSWGYATEYGVIYTCFRGDRCFREGSNYTFLLSAPINTPVDIFPRLDTEEAIPIYLDKETLVDAIPIGNSLTYVFNTSRIKKDDRGYINQSLIIELDVSQGNPDLYVNCDVKPQTLAQYKWQTTNRGKETLLLSQHELEDFPEKCELMYLTVYAQVCAAFTLDLHRQTESQNNTFIRIQPGVSEKAYIEGHEQVAYLLRLPKSDNVSVTVRLSANLGNPDMYVQECGSIEDELNSIVDDSSKCKIHPFDDVFMMNDEFKKDLLGKSENVGDDQISFVNDPNQLRYCANSTGQYCNYVIVVYPNAGNVAFNDHTAFSLHVSINKKHIQLKENFPIKGHLLVENIDLYQFVIVRDPNIQAIYFQMTPITGDPDLFAARQIMEPGPWVGWEKAACFCVNLLSYSKEELDRLPNQNVIYLSVLALSTTTYTINVHIERLNQTTNESEKKILLYDGVLQKAVFDDDGKNITFLVNIPETSSPKDFVQISLTPIKGKTQMQISVQGEGSFISFSPLNNTVSLSLSVLFDESGNMTKKGFEVIVQRVGQLHQTQFNIMYHTEDHVLELYEGRIAYLEVQPKKVIGFRFEIPETTDEMKAIMLIHTERRQGVHVKLYDVVPLDDQEKLMELTTRGRIDNIILLDAFQVKSGCANFFNRQCHIFGDISSDSSNSVQTQLQYVIIDEDLSNPRYPIHLFSFQQISDDRIYYFHLPFDGHSLYHAYYRFNPEVRRSTSHIFVEFDGELTSGQIIYSIVDPQTKGHKPSQWKFPSISPSDLNATTSVQNRYIDVDDICDDCYVLFSIYTHNSVYPTQYTIQITTNNTLLKVEEYSVQFFLEKNQPRRFEILINQERPLQFLFDSTSGEINYDVTLKAFNSSKTYTFGTNDHFYCLEEKIQPGPYLMSVEQSKLITANLRVKVTQQGCEGLNIRRLKSGHNVKLNLKKSNLAEFQVNKDNIDSILLRLFTELDHEISEDMIVSVIPCNINTNSFNCEFLEQNRNYLKLNNHDIELDKSTLQHLDCLTRTCRLQFRFESKAIHQVNVMTFVGRPLDHHLVLSLGEPYQSTLKAGEKQRIKIYITSERLYTASEYIITLNQIYGLTSFRILSHDEEDIRATQTHSVLEDGHYVWASLLIQEVSQLDRKVDYIELEVASQVFAKSHVESIYRLVVYRRGQSLTLAKGNFFADTLNYNQTQKVRIHNKDTSRNHSISISGRHFKQSSKAILYVKQQNSTAKYYLKGANQNNAFLIVLEQIVLQEVAITFSSNVKDQFEYIIFNRNGNTYSYPLQGLAVLSKALSQATTVRNDNHHILIAALNSNTEDVIKFSDSQMEPIIIEIRENIGEVEITSTQPIQQIQMHQKKLAIIQPVDDSVILLRSKENATYELTAHKLKLPPQFINLTDDKVWEIIPEYNLLPKDRGAPRIRQDGTVISIEFTPINPDFYKQLSMISGDHIYMIIIAHLIAQDQDPLIQADRYAYFEIKETPNKRITVSKEWQIPVTTNQQYSLHLQGVVQPDIVNMLLPNQRREVTIDYQPILLTANPKGDSFRIERISSNENKSSILNFYGLGMLFIVCLILLVAGGFFIWRRNKRLQAAIQYEQTSGREQVNFTDNQGESGLSI